MAKIKEQKNEKTKKKVKKEGFFKGIRKELKLVKWPTAKDIFKYTIATIIFCIILVLFFLLLTFIMAEIRGVFN